MEPNGRREINQNRRQPDSHVMCLISGSCFKVTIVYESQHSMIGYYHSPRCCNALISLTPDYYCCYTLLEGGEMAEIASSALVCWTGHVYQAGS